jgi:hypothetical protein
MSRCNNYCITVSGTTNEEIWREISLELGPKNVTASGVVDYMNEEIAEYNAWVLANRVVSFDKWLLWKKRIGTSNYGNLPSDNKRLNKIGHSYAPCPYSTQSSDLRTRNLLYLDVDEELPSKVDHSAGGVVYYMKTDSRGSKWGFSCTYPGCPYYLLTGQNYFFT